ncbi:glycosyl hydrolase family 5 [Roseomonas hellenica]|uniref:cellulase n=1 Tax=Plastoroseomonas hellenica TaxID=2687306 RepID=A0ABS5ERC2_9PROT|nr:glycosyl hydrolase family 8 [Plastoroseomonas hellenica]MBR0662849.1 glycosyl hydrolase family 5 [Plastoroseomonas hellenica]
MPDNPSARCDPTGQLPADRRSLLAACAGAAAFTLGARPRPAQAQSDAAGASLAPSWRAYRARFLTPDGRVIDTGNQNVSHSEGQGFGMIFAARSGDREAFERIWNWTRRSLRRPRDTLHAWRYRPMAQPPVDDLNNATDGDLYIAWALAIAAERWSVVVWRQQAASIAREILRNCVRDLRGRTLLLPGADGFDHADRIVINPSYYVFPALRQLAAIAPDPLWQRLEADGLALLREARFGRWGLTPDWLELPKSAGEARIAAGWPPRFSFDAVRTPLLLAWAGQVTAPSVSASLRFWLDGTHARVPAWADLQTNAVADFAASNGVIAIMRLLTAATGAARSGLVLPAPSREDDYYASSLILLSHAAAADLNM